MNTRLTTREKRRRQRQIRRNGYKKRKKQQKTQGNKVRTTQRKTNKKTQLQTCERKQEKLDPYNETILEHITTRPDKNKIRTILNEFVVSGVDLMILDYLPDDDVVFIKALEGLYRRNTHIRKRNAEILCTLFQRYGTNVKYDTVWKFWTFKIGTEIEYTITKHYDKKYKYLSFDTLIKCKCVHSGKKWISFEVAWHEPPGDRSTFEITVPSSGRDKTVFEHICYPYVTSDCSRRCFNYSLRILGHVLWKWIVQKCRMETLWHSIIRLFLNTSVFQRHTCMPKHTNPSLSIGGR